MLIIDLMRDNKSEYCEQIIEWTKNQILVKGGGNLICCLPETFEDYWKKTLRGNARTEYRKAVKNGVTIKQISNTAEVEDDLYKIQHSTETRQGRSLTPKYYGKKWENHDFSQYRCPVHKKEFWVAQKDGKSVAYMWLVFCGEYMVTNSIMGHIDYWQYGIMKYMIVEMLKIKIEADDRLVKYFNYGTPGFLKGGLRFFCRDLSLEFPERKIING